MLPITPAISIQQSITEQLNKKCNQNAILKGKSLKTLENKGFEALLQLFELENQILVPYFFVWAFLYILISFDTSYPNSMGYLNCCYHIVIREMLSSSNSWDSFHSLLNKYLSLFYKVISTCVIFTFIICIIDIPLRVFQEIFFFNKSNI